MRLINTSTRVFEEFIGDNVPKYAILSHTWEEEEVSYSDYAAGRHMTVSMKGFTKIDKTCLIAAAEGIQYAWVDTCCIDKSSSAELTEAINSMFRFYQRADVCYAFLSDLAPSSTLDGVYEALKPCRWFTRGWTLQELIATPEDMEFYNSAWNLIGTKNSLSSELSSITLIPPEVLRDSHLLKGTPVANKMSWAAHRTTTRVEDIAYCLLGIFDVNMPLLYGEEEKAFRRLQENIINSTSDLSIFFWVANRYGRNGILAETPRFFAHVNANFVRTHTTRVDFSMTNQVVKIRTDLAILSSPSYSGSEYYLSLHYKRSQDSHIMSIGVKLRKAGNGLFLRSDPFRFEGIRYDATLRYCSGEHHLLLEDHNAKVFQATPGPEWFQASWSNNDDYLVNYMAKSIRIRMNNDSCILDVYPPSRFDEKSRVFFLGDKDNRREDWGTVTMLVKPEGQFPVPVGPVSCVLYMTSWGGASAPQCSILGFDSYPDDILSLDAELRSWEHTTQELIASLANKKLPRMSSLLTEIFNTPFTIVITCTCTERKDRPVWAPEGKSWNLNIACTVEKTDQVKLSQKKRLWKTR